jgi:AcrR family transcriptional regulator
MPEHEKITSRALPSRSMQRTKTALRNGLIELMKTRPVLRISIKDLCAAAGVGRSTFYAHYKNQYDLLKEIETECRSAIEELMAMKQPPRKYSRREITVRAEKTLGYIAGNSNSIQVLLSENGDIAFQRTFIRQFISFLKNIKKQYADTPADEKTSECYSVFCVHGILALVQHWLKNDMYIPVPRLAAMIMSLTEGMM